MKNVKTGEKKKVHYLVGHRQDTKRKWKEKEKKEKEKGKKNRKKKKKEKEKKKKKEITSSLVSTSSLAVITIVGLFRYPHGLQFGFVMIFLAVMCMLDPESIVISLSLSPGIIVDAVGIIHSSEGE